MAEETRLKQFAGQWNVCHKFIAVLQILCVMRIDF